MKLRVAHYPQVPCKPFYVEVDSLEEAKKFFDILAEYDMYIALRTASLYKYLNSLMKIWPI